MIKYIEFYISLVATIVFYIASKNNFDDIKLEQFISYYIQINFYTFYILHEI